MQPLRFLVLRKPNDLHYLNEHVTSVPRANPVGWWTKGLSRTPLFPWEILDISVL